MSIVRLLLNAISPCYMAVCMLAFACLAHGEEPVVDESNPIAQLFKGERLDLWSLRPVVRPDVPRSDIHPIDAFVRQRLTSEALSPSPEADKRALARRLWFDLTGLPPTPEAMEEYLSDPAPDAYERLVDRLLASREFAEHWGRMWLDVVRYADSAGYDWDEFREEAWRYRDYVIDSLHNDKPYDQFLREQLAGDEMVSEIRSRADQEKVVATGFLRVGPYDFSAKLFKEDDQNRANVLADITETTATAMLGLTMGCCRCHDHKTEPFSHEDHYRLRAFFAGIDIDNLVEIEFSARANDIHTRNNQIEEEVLELDEQLTKLDEKSEEHAELSRKKAELEGQKQEVTMALAVREDPEPPPTFVLALGDAKAPLSDPVAPGIPSLFDPAPATPASLPYSSGRRTVLAQWITSPDNPLTSRVIVNRLWQGTLGTGIVATPNDFGYSGARPVNQPLLDWLASDFVDNGWSLKHTLRQIALSQTYRQTAYPPEEIASQGNARDTLNTLLWRANPRRLRSEMIRDAMFQVAGLLKPLEGGSPIWPELTPEALAANPTLLDKGEYNLGKGWYTSPAGADHIRSLYLVQKRSVRLPLLESFDPPDLYVPCGRREASTTSPQALTLLNSDVTKKVVSAFAERVVQSAGEEKQQQITTATRYALQREPTPAELELYSGLYDEAGLVAVCRVLVNTSEFLYTD